MNIKYLLNYLVVAALITGCGNSVNDTQFVERAKDFMDTENLPSAVIELKNALRQNPDNVEARWLLGRAQLELGNTPAAEKELARALELGMAEDPVLPLLANALLQQAKYDELLRLRYDGISPQAQAEVLSKQATALMAQGELEAAQTKITQALLHQPASIAALIEEARLHIARGDLATARDRLEALLANQPKHSAAWSLLGELERRANRMQQAEQALSRSIEFSSHSEVDRLKRALVRMELKNYEEAQTDINVLIGKLPQHFEVNYVQGLLHFHQHRYAQAREFFERSGYDRFLPALFYLGATHHLLGNQAQAAQLISRFMSSNPDNIYARKLLSEIELQKGDFAKVEKLLHPLLERSNKDDVAALGLLAESLILQGKSDEGLAVYEKVVALDPSSVQARTRLGAALLSQGEADDAVVQLEQVLRLDPENRSALEMLTLRHLQRKDYEDAFKTANEYREKRPDLASPYNLLGAVHLAKGEFEAGKRALEKARQIEPGNIAASQNLASLAIREKDYTTARERYEEVLTHHPNHLDTLMKLAILDEREAREEDMVKHLQQAIAAYPEAIQPRTSLARYYLSKGSPEQVPSALGALQNKNADDPRVLVVLGQAQLARRASKDAKNTFSKLVEAQPDSAQAHILLGQAYAQLDDIPNLKSELETALELNAKHLPARVALTRVMLLQRDIGGAKRQLEVLKANAPNNPEVLFLEGLTSRASGESEKALDIFTEVFKDVPSTPTLLTLAQQRWSMGDREGALAMLEKWIQANPTDSAARLRLANAYATMKRTTDAIAQYQLILKQSEDNVRALNNLAWHLKESDLSRALQYAEKASSLAPESAAINDTLAFLLMKNGDIQRALRISERAIEKSRDDLSILYHRAMILEAAGRMPEAKDLLVSVLDKAQTFPEREEAEQALARLQTQ